MEFIFKIIFVKIQYKKRDDDDNKIISTMMTMVMMNVKQALS